jgi:hypothetical protein
MTIDLDGMAIELPHVADHPNREAFRGVLTLVDTASDRAPSGSRGHQVVLTRRAAEAALPSLLGMGLDYSPQLDRHDAQRKIGVITYADVVGKRLEVSGYVFAKDFPNVVQSITRDGGRPGDRLHIVKGSQKLGMSFEIANARVADMKASVWTLTHAIFTGAAVLRRDKAAYQETWIEMG